MPRRVGLEGSFAIAEAVKAADVDVIAAYPITPQTHIVERLAEMVADGELDAEYIPVESEHSAMSVCLGASAVGARTFTATAGQGLELMHEVLFVASSSRLPVVMAVADRALSGPLNVWGDQSDAMATRDCGWIQIFAENNQQAYDLTLCAFPIGEDPRVLFPVMIHIDGFHLSHVIEPVEIFEKEEIEGFIPPYRHPHPLDPDRPVTMGAYGPPYIYAETKRAQEAALRNSKKVILEWWEKFAKLSGRKYNPVETYRIEGARTLLLVLGAFSQNAMEAVDKLRAEGEDVGLVRIRLWRPFPFEELREAVRDAEILIVFDRAVSFAGPGGPVFCEVKAALYNLDRRPKVVGMIGGLGGRDVSKEEFEEIIRRGREIALKGSPEEYHFMGVRE